MGRHGYASCSALAVDPTHLDSLYVLSAPHAGGAEEGVFPRPWFTADGGGSWTAIPAPDGFDPNHGFVGFSTTPGGVTAWFSIVSFEAMPFPETAVRGSFTSNGGQTWSSVALTCPEGPGPCLWQLHDRSPSLRSGLIRSSDGGKRWSWASLGGAPFAAEQFCLQGDGAVLEAVNVSTSNYWGFAPLLRSDDGGATWHWVDLPTPPGGWVGQPDAGLTMQLGPDGALRIGRPDGGNPTQWYSLERGETAWSPAP